MFEDYENSVIGQSILAIDAGPEKSGFVLFYDGSGKEKILESGKIPNGNLRTIDRVFQRVLLEGMDRTFGKAGLSTLQTAFQIGRFFEHFKKKNIVILYGRGAIKTELKVSNDSQARKFILEKRGKEFTRRLIRDAWSAQLIIEFHKTQNYGQENEDSGNVSQK